MAVVPSGLRDQVRDDVAQRERLAGVFVPTDCFCVPVAGSDDLVGVGCLLGVLVEQLGQGLFEPPAHLELGVVVRSGPLVGLAEKDDVDPEGFRPTQMADQAGDAHGRRALQRCPRGVRRRQANALGVHGQADIAQQLGEGGAFVERSRELGAFAQVDVGHGSSSAPALVTIRPASVTAWSEPLTRTVSRSSTTQRGRHPARSLSSRAQHSGGTRSGAWLPSGRMTHPGFDAYLICATPRSGSTLHKGQPWS